jgi:MoaA/NifB/PqqE/SkfB family radical SAM enzyme
MVDDDGQVQKNPKRLIKTKKVIEILRDAKTLGVKCIVFTGGGEPTVHPDHLNIIETALDLGFECALNTNGVLLRPGWERIYPRLAYVRFSVDAGNPEEYALVRRTPPENYRKVLNHISDVTKFIEGVNSECVVGVGYVVTPENHVNLGHGIKNLRETGAKYVRLAAMQSTDGEVAYGDQYEAAKAACKYAETLATPGFKVFNMFEDVLGERPDYQFCGMQQFVTYIGADLGIYRCCYTAYTSHGKIGDLTNKRFVDWFYSSDKKALISEFDAKSCKICPLNEKNRAINGMVSVPVHVNFV